VRSSIRTIVTLGLLAVCVALLTGRPAAGQEQQFGNLGDLKLVSGEVLHDCRIGYRTWGKLNADPSNAVLFPMWASGVTAQVAGSVGPGKLLDSSQDYIIAVDPLTNGVSSSPSNSAAQPRMKFPRITVRDMVNSEYRLLTGVLHIRHLKAVLGTSMGGMQTFQWMVTYPDFMDKAVPIVGSPQLAPYDLLLWQTQIDAITHDSGWRNGDYTEQPARRVRAEIGPTTSEPGGATCCPRSTAPQQSLRFSTPMTMSGRCRPSCRWMSRTPLEVRSNARPPP